MIIYSIWIFVYFLCVMQTQWSGYFSLVSQPMRLQCAGTTTLSHISAQERPVLHFLYSTSAPSCVQLILVAWPTVPQSTMIPSSCTCNRTTSGLHPPPKKKHCNSYRARHICLTRYHMFIYVRMCSSAETLSFQPAQYLPSTFGSC
jgi:hypothetical protein